VKSVDTKAVNTHCNTLQHTATHFNIFNGWLLARPEMWAIFGRCVVSVLQCVAVCCNVLQCVAVCCNVLQCVAVCCGVFVCGV